MKLKRITNLSVYLFVFSGSVFLLGEKNWWPGFYDPDFFGLVFLASALVIIFPRVIFRTGDQNKQYIVLLMSLIIVIATVLNALGQLYFYQLYKYGIYYDKVIHFIDPFLFMIVIAFFLEIWYGVPLKKALKISAVSVFAGCVLWEAYEFGVDAIFKTTESGIYGQKKFTDTALDILFDIAGIASAYYLLLSPKFFKKIERFVRRPMIQVK